MGLARRRRTLGYSQEKLAQLLGVDRTTVGRWESGRIVPQPPSDERWLPPSTSAFTSWMPFWRRHEQQARRGRGSSSVTPRTWETQTK